jgi:DNA-directed RNA polymerase specialized sigma24 family protein
MAASLGVSPSPANAAQGTVVQAVEKYCNASWRNAGIARQDWADCTQDTFVRMLERVSQDGLSDALADAQSAERRELNRCIWCTVQRWRRSPKYYSLDANQVPGPQGKPARERAALAEMREAMAQSAAALTLRHQTILQKCIDGYRIAEIADELAMSPARASDQKHKALTKLRAKLAADPS